jgi:phosphodiesterase/alkaline phosphatase D-like protein
MRMDRMGWAIGVLVGLTLSLGDLNGQDSPFYITPYLQNVSPNAITVMWETLEAEKGRVNYGEGGSFDQSEAEDAAVKIHEIRLEGLKTGTSYGYQVPAPDGSTFTASFNTAPEPGTENWRFVVYGDNRSNPDTHRGNVDQIVKLKPGIILNSGDLVARGKNYDHWKAQYFDPMRGLAE